MMDFVRLVGAFFWLPLIFWVTLFLCARLVAYPLFLKRWIRQGKTWCYVPEWWSKKPLLQQFVRFLLILLAVLTAFFTVSTIYWLVPANVYWFLFLFIAVLVLIKSFVNWSMKYVYKLELNAYFLEYKKQNAFYSRSGHPLSEDDLAGHTAWAFRNAMKKAESEKRLLKYLKEMSKLELASEKEDANA